MIEKLLKDDNFFDLKYGNRKLYFDMGEWVVVEAKSPGTPYKVVKMFAEEDLKLAIDCLKNL